MSKYCKPASRGISVFRDMRKAAIPQALRIDLGIKSELGYLPPGY